MSERTTFVRAAYATMVAGGGRVKDTKGNVWCVLDDGSLGTVSGQGSTIGNDWLSVPDKQPISTEPNLIIHDNSFTYDYLLGFHDAVKETCK